jgi:hypothetical protein
MTLTGMRLRHMRWTSADSFTDHIDPVRSRDTIYDFYTHSEIPHERERLSVRWRPPVLPDI